jgi:hypothetical protein
MDGFRARPPVLRARALRHALDRLRREPALELAEYLARDARARLPDTDGVEGLNEVHRLEEQDGKIVHIRCYCFCPDTLRVLGEHLGRHALPRRYRSPS